MSKRYEAYTKLKLDYPSKRILRITFDRPETYNSVDAQTHTQLTNILARHQRRSRYQRGDRHRRRQGVFGRRRF